MSLVLAALLCFAQGGAAAIFDAGVQALAQGDLPAAEARFREVLKSQPNHIGALGNLGVVYSKLDRPSDAIGVYRKALTLAPREPGLLLNLGLAHLKLNHYADAKHLFARIAAMGKPSAQVRELLATSQLFSGEVVPAMRDLEALRKESPDRAGVLYLLAVGYLKQKNPAGAQNAFESLMNALNPDQANFLAGRAYLETGYFEEAEKSLLAASGDLPGLQLELGKTMVSLRKEDEAAAALRKALRQTPGDTEAAYYLGALLSQSDGDVPEGIELLEQVRKKRPDSWGAFYYLGKALLKQEKTALAVPMLEQAAKLNPTESAIWFQLMQAYRKAGRVADSRAATARFNALKQEANRPLVLK
jgi:predicted Zn-dependent protease